MNKAILLLAVPAVLAGCTETLVVDETGEDVISVQETDLRGPDGTIDLAEDLRGRVVRVNTGTTENYFVFRDDGMFFIETSDRTQRIQGTYVGRGDDVCVTWAPRGTECWPRTAMLESAGPFTITSDRGQTMAVQLVEG
jgi:hypothetical protein